MAERGYPPTEREKSSAYWAWTEIQRRMAAPGVPFKGAPKPAGAPEPEEGEKPAPTIRELTPAMGAQAREPGALRPEEMPTPEQAGERTRRMRETERERLEEKGRLAERMPPGSAIRRATEEQVRKRRSTTEAERE